MRLGISKGAYDLATAFGITSEKAAHLLKDSRVVNGLKSFTSAFFDLYRGKRSTEFTAFILRYARHTRIAEEAQKLGILSNNFHKSPLELEKLVNKVNKAKNFKTTSIFPNIINQNAQKEFLNFGNQKFAEVC